LVLEDQVVEAGVEGLCDAGERADAGGDAPVFVSGDLAAVAADAIGELGLGPPVSTRRTLIRSPSGVADDVPSLGDGRRVVAVAETGDPGGVLEAHDRFPSTSW